MDKIKEIRMETVKNIKRETKLKNLAKKEVSVVQKENILVK
jgi:hypothetical protein